MGHRDLPPMQRPARPYPYDRWPRLDRAAVVQLGRASRWVHAAQSVAWRRRQERALAVLRALCGGQATVQGLRCPPGPHGPATVAPLVALVLEDGRGARWLVTVDAALAARSLDLLLGAPDPAPAFALVRPMQEVELGMLAYLVARMLGALDTNLVLQGVLTDAGAVTALLGPAPVRLAGWRLVLNDLAGHLWLWPVDRPPAAPATRDHRHLRHLELTLAACAGTAQLPRSTLHSLACGDLLVWGESQLRWTADGWRGRVALRARDSRASHWDCELQARSLTVVAQVRYPEAIMTEGKLQHAASIGAIDGETSTGATDGEASTPEPSLQGLADDAPIDLSLELAHFKITLGELAELAPGQVLLTGAPIGEQVILRAAQRAIARGELVDVEGEVAVRILELASTRATP